MAIDQSCCSDEDFPTEFIDKLVAHVVAYAEMLYAWGLVQQRAQLLKVLRLTAPSISASADKQMLSTCEWFSVTMRANT